MNNGEIQCTNEYFDDIRPVLSYYKIYPDVMDLTVATERSACFDLRAYLLVPEITVYSDQNTELKRPALGGPNNKNQFVTDDVPYLLLLPGERALIPTGLIFDIPEGYSVRAHPRSGLALKQGLILANCSGCIDEDYVEPSYILLLNISSVHQEIYHQTRLCQAELVRDERAILKSIDIRPKQKSNRNGGFGSSGNN